MRLEVSTQIFLHFKSHPIPDWFEIIGFVT
jgi:hypothetical protein